MHENVKFFPNDAILLVIFLTDASRALELLEDYHGRLSRPQDKQLRLAIERVIDIFRSRLFYALLGKDIAVAVLIGC